MLLHAVARKKSEFANLDKRVGKRPVWAVLRWMASRKYPPRRRAMVPILPQDYPSDKCGPDCLRIFFIGHSTLLIEFGDQRILTDPVWSDTVSPVRGSGPRRFSPPGIPFEQLPPLTAVLVSHNHYDHLDRATIMRLRKHATFVAPSGLGPWFHTAGCRRVKDLAWWQSIEIDGLKITATPAQHWSKRTPFDTNRTWWCSFVIEHAGRKVFFAGDSGYFPGFREIGERLGPFDVAALPIGAYEPQWFMGDMHMNPEEAVHAYEDLHANTFVAIHHSTFQLADEPPTEPPERLVRAWKKAHHGPGRLWIPRPGEHLRLLSGHRQN